LPRRLLDSMVSIHTFHRNARCCRTSLPWARA